MSEMPRLQDGAFEKDKGRDDVPRQVSPFVYVMTINHRQDMIYVSWISQAMLIESCITKKCP
jgi:hypothetical protein